MAIGSSGSSLSSISLSILRNTDKAEKKLSGSFEKLSSGLRINRAVDDAAGLAVAESLKASIGKIDQAARNVQDVVSFTQIADGALSQVNNLLERKGELAQQSANGTLSDDQRQTLELENQALTQEIERIVSSTEFNGINVFQGSVTGQVGTDSSANSQLTVGGTDISSLVSSLSSQNISTQAGARASLESVQSFSSEISQRRGQIGASQSRLDSVSSTLEDRKLGEAQALSRIRDADVATEVSNLVKNQILAQSGPSLLAQAGRLNADNVKALLG